MSTEEVVTTNGTGDGQDVKSEHTDITKASIRQKIWDYIEENDLAEFPRPVYNRIPNFKDSNAAAEKLKELEDFQNAKTVKINPDKPQEQARFLTLEATKTLLVPTPRMRRGLFNRVVPPAGAEKAVLRECCTFQGIKQNSKPVGTGEDYMVDLVVIGSVAVTETGMRLGKGEGFADLEYAIMASAGAVDENTVVVTTVHDCQITDIPEGLAQPHDLTVDYIMTPTQVIKCSGAPKQRPKSILWGMLTEQKYLSIPILKELREKDEEAGVDTTLMPTPEGEATPTKRRNRNRNNRRQRGRQRGRQRSGGEGAQNESMDDDGQARDRDNRERRPRRRRIYRRKSQEPDIGERPLSGEEGGEYREGRDRTPRRRRGPPACPPGCRIFVGGVTRRTRVSEFKTAIRAKGVYPRRVVWRGGRGFCFLEFEAPDRIDEDVGLLTEVIFNNVKLRPQIAIERGRDGEGGGGKVNGVNGHGDGGDVISTEDVIKVED